MNRADERNGMNRAPRSSLDLTARSFENQLMGIGHALISEFAKFDV